MMAPSFLILLHHVAVLLILCSSGCQALKHHLTIEADERTIFKIETFGFNAGGKFDLSFKELTVIHPPGEKEAETKEEKETIKAGFIMRRADTESAAQQDLEEIIEKGACIFDVIDPDYDFVLMAQKGTWYYGQNFGSIRSSIGEDKAGLYSLIFQRCVPSGSDHKVSFHVDAVFKNVGTSKATGMEWSYLSAGDAPLPFVYGAFFLLFGIAWMVWLTALRRDPAEFGQVQKIHFLMLGLLTLKVLTILFECVRYHYLAMYGVPQVWDVIYLILATCKGLTLFVTIALIGTGWSVLKGYLNDNEKKIIFSVLFLQVVNNVALVVLEETAPGSVLWLEWREVFHLVDIVCCIAILFPIVWSIKNLREAADVDGKAQQVMAKLQIFRTFYVLTVAYIYSTRILVYLLAASVPYNFIWLQAVFSEAITFTYYVITGWSFRPGIENSYLALNANDDDDDDDDDDAEREFGLSGDGDDDDDAMTVPRVSPRSHVAGSKGVEMITV